MENNKIITRDEILYDFIKKSFKEGLVPQNINSGREYFSNETTDDSICFAYDFGSRDADESAMIFFYPHTCAVPPRYRKHLKTEYAQDIRLLELDYQEMVLNFSNDINFLTRLKGIAESKYELCRAMLSEQIAYNFISSIGRKSMKQETAKVFERAKKYTERYNDFMLKLNEKIQTLSTFEQQENE